MDSRISSTLNHVAPYHLTQSAPFKFSVKKVRSEPQQDQVQASNIQILKKIKLDRINAPSILREPSTSRSSHQIVWNLERREIDQATEIPCDSQRLPCISSPSLSSTSEEFFTSSRLIFMKARAYYILRSAEINPYTCPASPGVFQIAPDMSEAAANVSYFPDEVLNHLMSKVLFIYPTITNIVSATAFVFWSRDELNTYKLPLKFQARHQNSKKPIIPGQEDYFKFWDTVFNFSPSTDRAIKLENAIKNFRYALIQPSALNLSFFNHLSSNGSPQDEEGVINFQDYSDNTFPA